MIYFKKLKINDNIIRVRTDKTIIGLLVDNFTAIENAIVFADKQPTIKTFLFITLDEKIKVFDTKEQAKQYINDNYKEVEQ